MTQIAAVRPRLASLRVPALIIAGTLALALSAKIQVPFWPVPVTLQSLAVLLIGAAYGPRLAVATLLAYLAEGLAGLPVFAAATAGIASFGGPTGGYLIGFVPAAGLVGWLAQRSGTKTPARAFATFALGHAALFVPGVLWLGHLMGAEKAIALGLTPFVFGTLVKTALAAALVTAARVRRA